jgi:hypothetical protein
MSAFDEEELDPHGECAAEIKRLRAALQKIADEEDIVNYGHTLPEIAKAALAYGARPQAQEGEQT